MSHYTASSASTNDSLQGWYAETVARIFILPLEHEFVRNYVARVDEHEFGQIVDRLDLRGDPEKIPATTVRILYWVYEQRLRQEVLDRALSGSYRITGCDEKFLMLESLSGDLATMPYLDYLNTAHWQEVRTAALKRADHRCQLCNSPDDLHVHHRTYERRGQERDDDVIVLCKSCHERFHEVENGRATRMPVEA